MDDITMIFIENVEAMLRKLAITKSELAGRMKVTRGTISRMLSGTHATTTKTLGAVAEALGVDVCELLCKPKRKGK